MKPRGGSCWGITIILLCLSFTTQGAIQCYCNREECLATHTCISHAEKCYSKLYTVYAHENQTAQKSKDEHGCIDLVHSESRDSTLCDSSGDVVKQLKEMEPLIMCCSDKMCNYRRNQDIQVDIIDSTHISPDDSKEEQNISVESDEVETSTDGEDVMFRAAVIAVPIAGGLILVILILMAVRMLREDYRRSDSQHRLLKAHSFIEQHFVGKNEKKVACSRSKKYYDDSIKNNRESTTLVHQHTHLHSPHNQQFGTNEQLINQHTDNNIPSVEEKSNVCISLLPSDKQSTISLV